MPLPSAVEIATCFCASLASAVRYAEPFPHFYARDLLPEAAVDALASLSLEAGAGRNPSGRREDNAARIFFGRPEMERFPIMGRVAEALQSAPVVRGIAGLCAAPILGCYLRLEYAVDEDGFWLAPHTDIGVKKFTCLISLAIDENQSSFGTDIYNSDNTPYTRAPFRRNGALIFVPSSTSWHGFAPRPIEGQRKSIILNYVGPEWRARDQLAFPERPVGDLTAPDQ